MPKSRRPHSGRVLRIFLAESVAARKKAETALRHKPFTVLPIAKIHMSHSTFLHEALQWCSGKKSTPFCYKKYHGCYEYFYKVILFVIQASVMQ